MQSIEVNIASRLGVDEKKKHILHKAEFVTQVAAPSLYL